MNEGWRYLDCSAPFSQRPVNTIHPCWKQTADRVWSNPGAATPADYALTISGVVGFFVFMFLVMVLSVLIWGKAVAIFGWLAGWDQKTPR